MIDFMTLLTKVLKIIHFSCFCSIVYDYINASFDTVMFINLKLFLLKMAHDRAIYMAYLESGMSNS